MIRITGFPGRLREIETLTLHKLSLNLIEQAGPIELDIQKLNASDEDFSQSASTCKKLLDKMRKLDLSGPSANPAAIDGLDLDEIQPQIPSTLTILDNIKDETAAVTQLKTGKSYLVAMVGSYMYPTLKKIKDVITTEQERLDGAATKIQASYRGMMGRKGQQTGNTPSTIQESSLVSGTPNSPGANPAASDEVFVMLIEYNNKEELMRDFYEYLDFILLSMMGGQFVWDYFLDFYIDIYIVRNYEGHRLDDFNEGRYKNLKIKKIFDKAAANIAQIELIKVLWGHRLARQLEYENDMLEYFADMNLDGVREACAESGLPFEKSDSLHVLQEKLRLHECPITAYRAVSASSVASKPTTQDGEPKKGGGKKRRKSKKRKSKKRKSKKRKSKKRKYSRKR